MKLLIFSCLLALSLARPEALNLLVDRQIKHQELENHLTEDLIPANEVSSSEESLYQMNKARNPTEKYELNRPSEESVTPVTEERVRRQVEYLYEEDTSAPRETKIEDVIEQYAQYQPYLKRLQELSFRYREPFYYAPELRKPQVYREPYMPEIYYPYLPLYMTELMAYPVEVPVLSTHNVPVPLINRATETVVTHPEEKN